MDPIKERAILREYCLRKHLHFTRYFFKHRENSKFIVNRHHEVISKVLDRVFTGEITRLIINIPPGYTKTEMAVLAFIARGFAINPSSRFIHTSYSDDLALLNSSRIKEIIISDEYQALWPLQFRKDSTAKKSWYTQQGGGLLAKSSGGTITGFRAGQMVEEFSGALIVDDPLKPEDAYSEPKRMTNNRIITNTLKSRLAHENIPIIFIMQRLHEDDATGFLLTGGTGEKWHHLLLPAEIQADVEYPKEYTHGIYIEHGLAPGPLWPYKHTLDHLEVMRESDPYTTSSQYDQKPAPLGGGIYKDKWWQYYDQDVQPQFEYRFIVGDTAQKTKEHNDYSVFGCWGIFQDNAYLIDVLRGKWEAPELRDILRAFYLKHRHHTAPTGRLRSVYIEDKSSGTDLIQSLRKEMPIQDIQRNIDKVTRAMDTVPYMASGRVFLPKQAVWLSDFKAEMQKFTPMMTHKHDDQVDMCMDGIQIGLMAPKMQAGGFS